MTICDRIKESLIDGLDSDVADLAAEALVEGFSANDILNDGLLSGMEVISGRFRDREIFLPDVLLAARAMHAGLDVIRDGLEGEGEGARGVVVIGTVQGDLHDIGKNLVGIMLRGSGIEVIDLGHDVSPEAFVEAARKHNANVVGMSALLTTTMPKMRAVIEALDAAGLGEVKTIVGGAPITEDYANEIGADAHGFDAARAVEVVKQWLH